MSEFPKMKQRTSPQGPPKGIWKGNRQHQQTKKLLLNLDARMRLLEAEAITISEVSPVGDYFLEEKIQKFRAKWGELISNA